MNFWEAINAGITGAKIRQQGWLQEEWIRFSQVDGKWIDESGAEFEFYGLGTHDWEVYKPVRSPLETARSAFNSGKFEDTDLAVVVGLMLKHLEGRL